MVIKWKNFKEIFIRRKGLGILGSSDILGTAITSIFWFYMASVIQPEKYGEIFYFISIVSIAFNLSNIGTQNNMVVLTAKEKKLESTLNSISLIFGTISSLILIIIFYQIDIIILLFGYIINALSLGYLVGKKFYSQYAKYLLIQKILTVGLGLSFFYLFGADGIITALGISYIGFTLLIIKLYKTTPLNFPSFKNNFSFIWKNYSVKIIGVFKENIDKLLIVPLIGFAYLGNYALALQFVSLMSIANIFFYKYILTNDASQVKNKHLKKIYLLFNIGLAIVGSISLPSIIPNFFPQFTDIEIISIMSFGIIPTAITAIRSSELVGNEKSKPLVISALIATAIMIGGMLSLVPEIGITGAAITYITAYSSQAAFLVFYPNNSKSR